MAVEIITAHEADQIIAMRKPLAWPIYASWPHCTGPCQQGRSLCMTPEACQTGVAEEDEWEAASWRDEIAFWVAVAAGTATLGLLLALAVGWRP